MRRWFVAFVMLAALKAGMAFAGVNWGAVVDGFNQAAEAEARRQQVQQALENQRLLIQQQQMLIEQRQRQEADFLEMRRHEAARQTAEENALTARKAAEEKAQAMRAAAEVIATKNAFVTGTGFFINSNGHLITNSHVIDGRSYIAIRDAKGLFYKASVVANDPARDLAIIKVDGKFPALHVKDADNVAKGQHVYAVGYPSIAIQNNESKVTDGIISSFSGLDHSDWYQISVPVQGGNSGGPLVNESGEVVGVVVATVNTSVYLERAGKLPQNVNFAIKSSVVAKFLSQYSVQNQQRVASKPSVSA